MPRQLILEGKRIGHAEVFENDTGGVRRDRRPAGILERRVGGGSRWNLEAARLCDLTLDIDIDRQRLAAGNIDHVAAAKQGVAGFHFVVQVHTVIYGILSFGVAVRDRDFAQV